MATFTEEDFTEALTRFATTMVPSIMYESMRSDPIMRGSLCVYVLVVTIVAIPLIILPLAVCLKIDGTISLSWATTLIPLWLTDFVLIIAFYFGTKYIDPDTVPKQPPPEEEGTISPKDPTTYGMNDEAVMNEVNAEASVAIAPKESAKPVGELITSKQEFIGYAISIVSQIILCLRLDNIISCPWTIAILPSVIADAFLRQPASMAFTVQCLLVLLKADDVLHWNWAIIFIPQWIILGLALFLLPIAIYFAIDESDAEGFHVPGYVIINCAAIYTFLSIGAVLASFILVTLRLERVTTLSALIISLPYFGFIVSLIGFGALLIFAFIDDESQEQTEAQPAQPVQPPEVAEIAQDAEINQAVQAPQHAQEAPTQV